MAASTVDTGKVELMAAEQQALADAALSEFAAAYGIECAKEAGKPRRGPTTPAAPPPAREMGPEKQG